ncbi:hypothetical protein BDV96DRAFT_217737 [Lophiotrema nucula]|uniref:Uncharacterized protein n=1 Tax=Lophiotrema nucula TaxID=690887 RepID=A0A6A5ZS00_9PLEO|nr:hypothetical protein BDV96DRAFT_217737 [Lophiotrema nucula]
MIDGGCEGGESEPTPLGSVRQNGLHDCPAISVRRFRTSIQLIDFSAARRTVAAAACYFPNGTIQESNTPCNESASISHCCVSSDACRSDGFCF